MAHKHADTGKAARHEAILVEIRKSEIGTQDALVKSLRRHGIRATQASISRDIAELGLVKAAGRYQAAASPEAALDPEMPLRLNILSAQAAGPHLMVLKTATGTAQQVGLAFDGLAPKGVVGTIAGDDTVFIATSSKSAGDALLAYLRALINKELA